MPVTYELVHVSRSGRERVHSYTSEEPLQPGSLVHYEGRHWLAETVDGTRVTLKPARYRLKLRHPDGREELGALRRYRPDAPRVGHTFSTVEDGAPVSWQVADERLAQDDQGEPYLELTAERDYSEQEESPTLPEHELEHAFARGDDASAAAATLARADEEGLYVELVALEPGEAPDWAEAEAYIDALELEEIDDDLLQRCGVDPNRDPRESWLGTVKERLGSDLVQFRADLEGDRDEIEEWEFQDGRVFAALGRYADEANPESGHGWMTRLYDASALGAAGFSRVRKAELQV
ncbi:MAG: hypothetical protein E6G24_11640 [Actinobacteria bacterium]|nr:MAG: hypothetical protein E6G24_11640 [Actinomycetota bacterium]